MLHTQTPGTRSPEETRNRILFATRQLFAKKGRRGTTTREIAELAGVNEATLFRHFGHKDALIEACAQHFCGAAQLQELLAKLSGDMEADLRTIARTLAGRMEQVRDLIAMSLVDEETEAMVGETAWRAPVAIKEIISEYIGRLVERGDLRGDPELLARLFMGMIFAHVLGRKRFPVSYTTDEIIDFQLGIFLNGARAQKA